jgi:putative membrane protein
MKAFTGIIESISQTLAELFKNKSNNRPFFTLVYITNDKRTTNKLNNRILGITLGFVYILGISACTNNPNSDNSLASGLQQTNQGINHADSLFLKQAAEVSLEEIRLGDLATMRCLSKEGRELGQMLVLEHSNSLNSLTELAKKKNVEVPSAATDKAIAEFEKLNKNSGIEFDKAYCLMMVGLHNDAIQLTEYEINGTSDTEIKIWSNTNLLALKMHLDHILICQKTLEKM